MMVNPPRPGRFMAKSKPSIVGTACCEMMSANVNVSCPQGHDVFECADNLIYYSARENRYGLLIHDGGASFVEIVWCPWCGSDLKSSTVTLERRNSHQRKSTQR